jgi:hypothetical protein
MQPKSEMLPNIMTIWMVFGISCAALPFLHAAPALKISGFFGDFAPLFIALLIGLAAGGALSVIARHLSGVAALPKEMWGSLTPGSAAVFGIIGWGLPIGLVFALDQFLRSKNFFAAAPSAVIWPLVGVIYGLTMRWSARKREA